MPQYITDIDVSVNEAEQHQLCKHGFTQVHVNLNPEGKGNTIYLWYKTSDCPAITRIQFSFTDKMKEGLVPLSMMFQSWSSTDAEADATKVQPLWERLTCDLNRRAGGNWIYLWVKRETQTYICDINATLNSSSDATLFHQGYIRMDEDTNRDAGGAYVFLWY
ncbi:hypothetical protein CRENBAI_008342 [Crenichthys baileyi]|uniref:MABP domain-containing protein n=1 Tax=Crenichthys baileyi TaxID=28760 RepID=A0AAV9S7N2_9TELE